MSDTAKDLFLTTDAFGKIDNAWGDVELNLLKDPIQNIESGWCGTLQLYFHKNLFGPRENSKIIAHKNSTRCAIQNLLSKFSSLNQNEYEIIFKNYVKENYIHLDEQK